MTCANCMMQQHSEQYTSNKGSESVCVCKHACVYVKFLPNLSLYLISRLIFSSLSFSQLALFADINYFLFCSFLAKRGVREDIATFEARNITPEIRQSVEELLNRNTASFDPKVPLAGHCSLDGRLDEHNNLWFFTLRPSNFALFLRMRNVQAQQLLPWPPG